MAGGADYVFKLVIIGDQSVGKSSLIRRFHEDSFDQKLPTTIGVDFFIHDLVVNGRNVKVMFVNCTLPAGELFFILKLVIKKVTLSSL